MNIERLKELKGITEQLYQDGNVPLTYCDDVFKLIDDAIARQMTTCPDCGGSGVYQEYDEYDRYYVHSCATCKGLGEIARQSVTSEDVIEAIDLLKEIQHDKYVIQNYTENDVKNYKLISFAITALHKIGTNTVDVAWTEAYQSYESAGDEAVPYCPKCDADIEDYQKFCKDCGVELIWP